MATPPSRRDIDRLYRDTSNSPTMARLARESAARTRPPSAFFGQAADRYDRRVSQWVWTVVLGFGAGLAAGCGAGLLGVSRTPAAALAGVVCFVVILVTRWRLSVPARPRVTRSPINRGRLAGMIACTLAAMGTSVIVVWGIGWWGFALLPLLWVSLAMAIREEDRREEQEHAAVLARFNDPEWLEQNGMPSAAWLTRAGESTGQQTDAERQADAERMAVWRENMNRTPGVYTVPGVQPGTTRVPPEPPPVSLGPCTCPACTRLRNLPSDTWDQHYVDATDECGPKCHPPHPLKRWDT